MRVRESEVETDHHNLTNIRANHEHYRRSKFGTEPREIADCSVCGTVSTTHVRLPGSRRTKPACAVGHEVNEAVGRITRHPYALSEPQRQLLLRVLRAKATAA